MNQIIRSNRKRSLPGTEKKIACKSIIKSHTARCTTTFLGYYDRLKKIQDKYKKWLVKSIVRLASYKFLLSLGDMCIPRRYNDASFDRNHLTKQFCTCSKLAKCMLDKLYA